MSKFDVMGALAALAACETAKEYDAAKLLCARGSQVEQRAIVDSVREARARLVSRGVL